MITSAAALLAIGINMSVDGPASQTVTMNVAKLPAVHDALAAAIDKKGPALPGIATSVLGKVFIQDSGNNGLTPSKIVIVTPKAGTNDQVEVHMESLDYQGHRVSDASPNDAYLPFFTKTPQGAVVPVSQAFASLGAQNAFAQAGTNAGTNIQSRALAVHRGAMEGKFGSTFGVDLRR